MRRPPTGTPEPDKFLFEAGTAALDERRWLVVARVLPRADRHLSADPASAPTPSSASATPTSAKASAESYVLALNEFREFLTFYPTHERADYAQYKLGMTHFYQMHSRRSRSDRDARGDPGADALRRALPAERADRGGQAAAARGEGSPEPVRVQRRLLTTIRSQWYPGAVDRFKALLEQDPEFTNRDAVYFYLGECS